MNAKKCIISFDSFVKNKLVNEGTIFNLSKKNTWEKVIKRSGAGVIAKLPCVNLVQPQNVGVEHKYKYHLYDYVYNAAWNDSDNDCIKGIIINKNIIDDYCKKINMYHDSIRECVSAFNIYTFAVTGYYLIDNSSGKLYSNFIICFADDGDTINDLYEMFMGKFNDKLSDYYFKEFVKNVHDDIGKNNGGSIGLY